VRRNDLASTLFFIALAAFVIVSGFRLGFGEWREPGPGFLAVLSGLILGTLAAIWFGVTITARRRPEEAIRRFAAESKSLRKVGLTSAALMAFALLLEPLGFPLTTLAFMLFLLRIIEPQPWAFALTMSVVTVVLCVVVFQVWLQVQFPDGPVSIHDLRRWIF
jgi:hypothetical protein